MNTLQEPPSQGRARHTQGEKGTGHALTQHRSHTQHTHSYTSCMDVVAETHHLGPIPSHVMHSTARCLSKIEKRCTLCMQRRLCMLQHTHGAVQRASAAAARLRGSSTSSSGSNGKQQQQIRHHHHHCPKRATVTAHNTQCPTTTWPCASSSNEKNLNP